MGCMSTLGWMGQPKQGASQALWLFMCHAKLCRRKEEHCRSWHSYGLSVMVGYTVMKYGFGHQNSGYGLPEQLAWLYL